MAARRILGTLALAGLLACGPLLAAPALAQGAPAPAASSNVITLTPEETQALKLELIAAKPNLSTVTMSSFLFPGSAQAYMGHTDRTLIMWGAYLLVFAGAKAFWPDTALTAGQKTSDVVVAGAFMGMAAISALDAYLLARAQRDEYDRLIDRLADKATPEIKYLQSIPEPVKR